MPYNLLTSSLIPVSINLKPRRREFSTLNSQFSTYPSIDGSIFLTCTTCIVYQYFKELVRFVFKSGCKGKRFILNYQTFQEVFFVFLFIHFSGSLCERERINKRQTKTNRGFFANQTAKIRTFLFYFQTFQEVFCSLFVSPFRRFCNMSIAQGFLLLESGCKSRDFFDTLQI